MTDRNKTVWALAAGALALIIVLCYLVWSNRLEAIRAAEVATRGYAAVLEAQLEATFRRTDAELVHLARDLPLAALNLKSVPSHADTIDATLDSRLFNFPELDGLCVFGPEGELLYSSNRRTTTNANIGDREHFQKARDDKQSGLIFSKVILARTTGQKSMVALRPIRDEQGVFRGVATATLKFEYWLKLFQSLDVGRKGSIAVYRMDDRTQVLRWPETLEKINVPLPPGGPAARAFEDGQKTTTALLTSAADGLPRIYSFQALRPYPFFISVGMGREEALGSWWQRTLTLIVIVSLLLVLLIALFFRLWRTDIERNRLAAVAQGSNDAIFVRDKSGTIAFWNDGARKLYGYSFDEVAGKDSAFLTPKELLEERKQNMAVLEQGGTVENYETVRLRKDGSRVEVSIGVSAVRDSKDRIIGIATIARDITTLKQAEATAIKAAQRLDIALDGSRICVWESNLLTNEIWLDSTWSKMLGHPECETITTAAELLTMVPAGERKYIVDAAVQTMKGQAASYSIDHRVKKANGEWLWIQSRGRVVERDADGRPVLMSGTNTDITERKLAERSQAQLAAIVTSSEDAIVSRAPDDTIISWNSGAERMFGWTESEVIGRSFRNLLSESGGNRRGRFEKLLRGEATPPPLEDIRLRKDGTSIHVETTMSAVKDDVGNILFVSCIMRDITDRLKAEHRIQQLATKDSLTGLMNRSSLMDQMATAISRAARSQTQLAAMFIDLDRFKVVNDTLGHAAGDDLLRECARRISASTRDIDVVARLGGDEFMVLLTDLGDTDTVVTVAERMLNQLNVPYHISGQEMKAPASIGICLYPADAQDASTLVKNADIAMYHAKEKGRNNYQFFAEEMNQRLLQRSLLESELRAALENNEFVLHFQPQVNVVSGEIQGAESLIRWQHPVRGLLYPDSFITVAEESGLIVPIGEWVLDHACHTIKNWHANGVNVPYVGVNVTAAQLNENLVTLVRQALARHEIAPGWLMLEITETMLMQQVDEAIGILRRIRELGVRISMDDFGTGYSSLSVLQRLPLDTIKIDRSFISAIDDEANNVRALTIIGAIIAIAKELGLGVVAEGVEQPTQLAFLRTLNCDAYQGYLFCKPLDTITLEKRFMAPVRSVLEDEQGNALTMTMKVTLELPLEPQ